MKIKLAILENDINYLNRIVSVFSTKYADKVQMYSFTDLQRATNALSAEKIDVFIANDYFHVEVECIPKRCSFAYFVDNSDIDTFDGQRAICKFQKVELIYKQILSIYSENAGNMSGIKINDDSCKIIMFSSPSGGSGTSTMAVAYALNLASKRKKVLYLNFEDFASSDLFFLGEGQFDMSDVIFALKSKKANLTMKLESYVKRDSRGVYYFSSTRHALDMLEFKIEEKLQLLSELNMSGLYEYIIVDSDFALDKEHMDLFNKSHTVVMVSDGTENSNIKTDRAYNAILTLDQTADTILANRFVLLYNKFSNKISKLIENENLRNIGGAPVYTHATFSQIVDQLVSSTIFDKID